jgi:hypothetical protein
MSNLLKLTALVIVSVFLVSCAKPYDGTTRKADPPANIHKIFVALQMGEKQHERFPDQVIAAMTKRLQDCGVEVKAENHPAVENSLALTNDPNDIRKHINEYAPSYVLYIWETTVSPFNPAHQLNRYQAFIHVPGAPIGNNIWHANIQINTLVSLNDGETLADKVYEEMWQDKMLPPSCPQP